MPNPHDIPQFYAGKRILLTGATGFVGKVALEKILRSLPDVAVVYVFIRPSKGKSPQKRLMEDIMASPIFERLHKEIGSRKIFEDYFRSKLIAVGGDMLAFKEGLGITKEDLETIKSHGGVDIILHCAATVDFTERIDRAVGLNILGTLCLMDMAANLWNVGVFVHVSTGYVNANKPSGSLVKEKLYPLDFDPFALIHSVEGDKTEVELERITTHALGSYPNTYTLTKSMAEVLMVLRRKKINLPLHIVRPTIIGAAFREPIPGWIDSVAAAAAVFMAGGLGLLSVMPGNPRNVGDLIPVDHVVNHMLCAAMETFNHTSGVHVSHSSSSTCNPANWRQHMMTFDHFRKFQSPNQGGPCTFRMIKSPQQFELEWFLRYTMPSSAYRTISELIASPKHIKNSKKLARGVERARSVNVAFESFTRNEWFFENKTALRWAEEASAVYGKDASRANPFNVDPRVISWRSYLENFAIGLRRIVLNEDIVAPSERSIIHNEMSLTTDRLVTWDADHHRISFPGILPDVTWAYTHSRRPGYTKKGLFGRVLGLTGWSEGVAHEAKYVPRDIPQYDETIRLVLQSSRVQKAITKEIDQSKMAAGACKERARAIVFEMAAKMNLTQARYLAYSLRKIWRRVYEGIRVDEAGLERVRLLASNKKVPLVLLPSHRSYVDFVALSYVFFAYNLPLPHIMAGEDFLGLGPLSEMMRGAGAFFIKREFSQDPLYSAVFEEYIQRLLLDNQCVEFFLEGTRSRTGKTLAPKFGALKTSIEPVLDGRVEDIHFIPVSIDFERTLEETLYSDEMLGKRKPGETLLNLVKSAPLLMSANYGYLSLQFGEPLSLRKYISRNVEAECSRRVARGERNSNEYDPIKNHGDRYILTSSLAYELLARISESSVALPTHIAAAIILNFRGGIKLQRLMDEMNWLHDEILARGGHVAMVEGAPRKYTAKRAIKMLGHLVLEPRHEYFVPNTQEPSVYKNFIALGSYRNKILHHFVPEALWASAMYAVAKTACDDEGSNKGRSYPVSLLLGYVTFLDKLLSQEFVRDRTATMTDEECGEEHCRVLYGMIASGVFDVSMQPGYGIGANTAFDGNSETRRRFQLAMASSSELDSSKLKTVSISVASNGERMFSFLCSIVWPFIDGYYSAAMCLPTLVPNGKMETQVLLDRAQWLSETLFVDKHIEHYECCASNTLYNAMKSFVSLNVLSKEDDTNLLELVEHHRSQEAVVSFIDKIGEFRKTAQGGSYQTTSIADFPILAKRFVRSAL
jgi:glyceronephosphate O-acyltransferase